MPRLIDANKLKTKAVADPDSGEGIVYVQDIDDAPTVDVVEVVRCKDCRYCDPEWNHCDHPMSTSIPIPRKPDDFCSYGERKTDG